MPPTTDLQLTPAPLPLPFHAFPYTLNPLVRVSPCPLPSHAFPRTPPINRAAPSLADRYIDLSISMEAVSENPYFTNTGMSECASPLDQPPALLRAHNGNTSVSPSVSPNVSFVGADVGASVRSCFVNKSQQCRFWCSNPFCGLLCWYW